MGYSVQQFVDAVDQNLMCGICAEVLEKAVLTPCGHSFCEVCLQTWLEAKLEDHGEKGPSSCPACRAELFPGDTAPVLAIRGLVDGLVVQCPNVENGCKMVLKLGNMEGHLKSCSHGTVQCCGCSLAFKRGELAEHHNTCAVINKLSSTKYSKMKNEDVSVNDLTKQITILEVDLKRTKDALKESEGTARRVERELREMRFRMQSYSDEEEDEFDNDFDPEYNYGYSPQSIAQLSNMISRYLLSKPYYVDRGFTFAAVKRCYDYYHTYPGYSQDVNMLIATAFASNWFTENQRHSFEIWLENIAKDRCIR